MSNERKITQCELPDSQNIDVSFMKDRFWYPIVHKSKYQDIDKPYQAIKNFLTDFYTKHENTWLSWTKYEDCPITIDKLDYDSGGCFGCGILYEVPSFSGKIRYEGNVYDYNGTIYGERWCQYDSCTKTTPSHEEMIKRINSPDFLFKLDISNCPTAMFLHIYTELDEMSIHA